MGSNGNALDLAGQRFGFLTACTREGRLGGNAAWCCACDCGREVLVSSDRLRSGRKTICNLGGHTVWSLQPRGFTIVHKHEYSSWRSMRDRCADTKGKNYKNYGGRGITVCERWQTFEKFLVDMGPKPTPQHTIGRLDSNGNYEKSNCEWQTPKQQGRHLRRSLYVEWRGKHLLLLDLVARSELKYEVVYGRLKNGWTLRDALSKPVHPRVYVTYRGKRRRLIDLTTKNGISIDVVRGRLNIGWTLKEALSTPTHQKKPLDPSPPSTVV